MDAPSRRLAAMRTPRRHHEQQERKPSRRRRACGCGRRLFRSRGGLATISATVTFPTPKNGPPIIGSCSHVYHARFPQSRLRRVVSQITVGDGKAGSLNPSDGSILGCVPHDKLLSGGGVCNRCNAREQVVQNSRRICVAASSAPSAASDSAASRTIPYLRHIILEGTSVTTCRARFAS